MPASLRELRQRRSSVTTIKKVTRAMELIAASRIIKAQGRAQAAAPYARELTKAVSAVATFSNVEHPLTTESENPTRAAVLLITSDRGLAGAYSSSVIKEGEQLNQLLRESGREPTSSRPRSAMPSGVEQRERMARIRSHGLSTPRRTAESKQPPPDTSRYAKPALSRISASSRTREDCIRCASGSCERSRILVSTRAGTARPVRCSGPRACRP